MALIVVCGFCSCGLSLFIGFPSGHHDPQGYNRLLAAIEANDAVTVESILRSGVSPNVFPNAPIDLMSEGDLALLNAAASSGKTKIVKILLDYGADPNIGDGWHRSPLCAAATKSYIDTMDLLVKRGAKVNDDAGGSNALWRAAMDGQVKAVSFLIDHGANPNTTFGPKPLEYTLKDEPHSEAIIKLLRAKGARDSKSNTSKHP